MNLEEAFLELGITQETNEDDTRRAYKRLALATHPDKNPDDPEAKIRFQKISEAYNRIINAADYSSDEDRGAEDEECQCCQCRENRFHMSEEEMYAMFNFIFRGGPSMSNYSWQGLGAGEPSQYGDFNAFQGSESEEDGDGDYDFRSEGGKRGQR
mmetsp:Transcript_19627/g.30884  ORF Transcript_19627/g.30884 Transcript_19627/m.30884 type:complete len:155 (+) Transcript_19627:86-550(+)